MGCECEVVAIYTYYIDVGVMNVILIALNIHLYNTFCYPTDLSVCDVIVNVIALNMNVCADALRI